MEIVVNPFFKSKILDFTKTTCMVQNNVPEKSTITFSAEIEGKRQPFASAICKIVVGLRVDPLRETMQMHHFGQWHPLEIFRVKRIIKNEGFEHTDDFWKQFESKPFEMIQIYFDTVKEI